ncbi:hypothetical protein TNCV_2502141, partial [Trichonephila clavipes]
RRETEFKTLNKETATHIGIREAEDWFRPIDLAKECDIYISSRSGSHKETPITYGYTQDPFKNRSQNFKPKIKENYPQYLERENKNCYICGDSSHCARDLLCKKANCAMKTSSVEFISRSPTPSPMNSNYRRFSVAPENSLSPGSGSEGKREIVLNRRPELYRGKYRCVQPKINLLKRRSYACETMFSCGTFRMSKRFSFGLYGRTAADSVQSGWPIVAAKAKQSSRAGAANQNLNSWTLEQKLEREKRTREVREQALPSEYHRQTYL